MERVVGSDHGGVVVPGGEVMERCNTCDKPHLLGFVYGHEFSAADDFISQTIRDVDAYLAGERADEQAQVRNAGVDMAGEWDAESLAEYEEWSAEVSEQTDSYFDVICGTHGDERDPETGLCPQCAQELADERRNDL